MSRGRPLINWTPELYDRFARRYDAFARLFPVGDKGHRRVIGGLSAGSLLDVACGTGTLLALAHANGLTCYGIDTSRGMLDQARAKAPHAEFERASFYDMPYADGCFDYVVETNAVGVVGVDARRVLSEMLRVCKSGGEVRIADYARPLKETWLHRLLARLGTLIGDEPQDYRRILAELGYEAEVEVLGGYGMCQFFRVQKH